MVGGSSPSRPGERNRSIMRKFQNYIKDVITELKKVTWPSWDELKGATVAVVVFALIASAYVALVDFALLNLVGKIAEIFGA